MAYYNHRHSGIDETNILQVVIAVEGETGTLLFPMYTADGTISAAENVNHQQLRVIQ